MAGATTTWASRAARNTVTSVEIVSTFIGRCGPCCSVAPTGITATPLASRQARSTSGWVMRASSTLRASRNGSSVSVTVDYSFSTCTWLDRSRADVLGIQPGYLGELPVLHRLRERWTEPGRFRRGFAGKRFPEGHRIGGMQRRLELPIVRVQGARHPPPIIGIGLVAIVAGQVFIDVGFGDQLRRPGHKAFGSGGLVAIDLIVEADNRPPAMPGQHGAAGGQQPAIADGRQGLLRAVHRRHQNTLA